MWGINTRVTDFSITVENACGWPLDSLWWQELAAASSVFSWRRSKSREQDWKSHKSITLWPDVPQLDLMSRMFHKLPKKCRPLGNKHLNT